MAQRKINDVYDRSPDYRRAVCIAYRTLLHLNVTKLPVDVVSICQRCKNTLLIPYSQAQPYANLIGINLPYDAPSAEAFTYRIEFLPESIVHLLLYNDEPGQSRARFRFTLAHELGHIVLKHRESSYVEEAEADAFAQHLLCPQPLLAALDGTINDWMLAASFGVSLAAAHIILNEKSRALYVGAAESEALRRAFGVDAAGPGGLLQGTFEKMLEVHGL